METKRICPSCQKPLPPNVPLGLCPECLIKSGFNTGTEPGNPGQASGYVPPPVQDIQQLFPQLEILELIGKGGMGAVYKARQSSLDRLVALKILPPGAADDAGFAERFNREARALARLNHPQIVAVHDFGHAAGQPYLVMEFVDGVNLRQVEQAGRLAPEQALEIVPQICEALQFAHNEGVVHRDIKPENILIDKRGRVKITDFGIAKILGVTSGKGSLTGAKDVVGTPHYMAPEQVEHPQAVDHRADIYSLGVVFYELLTGELPLGKFQPPSKKVQVDVRLDEVVLHTLEKEPERRYQHVSEVKSDVETIAGSALVAQPAAKSPMVRMAEALWGITFRSPAAITLLNLSALGCLGFLSALGTSWSAPFSAFFSLFALIVVAYLLETANARASSTPATGERSQGLSGWLRRSLVPEDTAARWAQRLSFGAALAILVLGFLELPKFDLRPHELFFGILLVLILALVMVVAGYLVGAAGNNRLRQEWAPRPRTPAASGEEGALAMARQAVKAPASWLVATGILNWVSIPLAAVVIVPLAEQSQGLSALHLSNTLVEVVCVASLALCSVVLFAALKMQRLEAYRLAMIGSLLAIFVAPGNVIGLPVGIWSLAVLSRREVREAFGQARRLPSESARPKRGSLAWMTVAAMALLVFWLAIVVQRLQRAPTAARASGTEIEVALSSLGRQLGDRFLDLDTGRIVHPPGAFHSSGWTREQKHEWLREQGVDLMLMGSAYQSWSLLTPVDNATKFTKVSADAWQRGLGPENGGRSPESAEAIQLLDQGIELLQVRLDGRPTLPDHTFAFQTANGARGLVKVSGLTFEGNEVVGLKLRFKKSAASAESKQSAAPPTVTPSHGTAALQGPSFGPLIESVLKTQEVRPQGGVAELLDLDTGRRGTSTNFGDNDRETHVWVRTNQLDVLGVIERGQIAVLCFDMAILPAVSNGWETVNAQNLATNWNLAQIEPGKITGISPATDNTDTWLLRTREGGRGILQILGQSNEPVGVKIRYRLVQTADSVAADPPSTVSARRVIGQAPFVARLAEGCD